MLNYTVLQWLHMAIRWRAGGVNRVAGDCIREAMSRKGESYCVMIPRDREWLYALD